MFRTALALSMSLLAGAASAQTPGASAFGSAFGDFQIGCTTCPHIPIVLTGTPIQQAGGDGFASAAIAYDGQPVRTPAFEGYTLAGSVHYAATASFSGPLWTPLLGAYAEADNESAYLLVGPNNLPVGIDLYQAYAQASTQMLYTYLGSTASSYTFHFDVEGLVSNEESSLFGSAAIYAGPTTNFETGLIDFGFVDLKGTGFNTPAFATAGSFSVSVSVNPGDSFWLVSQLGALVTMSYNSADSVADAMNTLRVSGIDGDTALLAVSAVPEPAPWMLLALGLFSTAALRRRAAQ
jgi:hypothetical protein